MKNGDRIRSMSDNELAEFLDNMASCEYDITGKCFNGCKEDSCTPCIRMWLGNEENLGGIKSATKT